MEDYIKDAVDASGYEILLEAYDKEWALKDLGKREGFKDGFSQGLSQGIEQRNIDIIHNMSKENIDIDLISEITGLSIEKINSIKATQN